MSTPTTPMPTPSAQADVAAFVAAVRAQLDDLSTDEITELTGGLEADLTDELADAGESPAQRYGDPAEYAAELRSAAGLPPRGRGRRRPEFNLAERVNGRLAQLERQPWWPQVRDFLVVLRPAWWVLRAWLVVEGVLYVFWGGQGAQLINGGLVGLLLLLAAIVVSVEAGRRHETLDSRRRTAVIIVNVLAVLAVLPLLAQATTAPYSDGGDVSYSPAPGLSNNGDVVSNVFPYDSEGRPLSGVQLYDQNGHALDIGEADRIQYDDNGNELRRLPGTAPGMPPRWNVFPLKEQPMTTATDANGNLIPGPTQDSRAPFAAVPPLLAPTPSVSPAATPTATPTPSVTPAPTPTPTPTPKKS